MRSPFFVKVIPFQGGERFPMLLERTSGMPLFNPTVYLVSMRRAKGLAEATMERDARAIIFLYCWGAKNGVDVEKRFRDADFLSLHEVDSLVQESWTRLDQVLDAEHHGEAPAPKPSKKLAGLSLYRRAGKRGPAQTVSADTAGVRLIYVRDYLDWLALQRLGRLNKRSGDFSALDSARLQMKEAITARIPSGSKRIFENADGQRMGLDLAAQSRLLEVVDPKSPENPWRDSHTRERNRLFILTLLLLGVRRGEALGLRIGDIDLQQRSVTIHRTPEDEQDPRARKPQAKTRGRLLGLSPDLARLIRDYIVKYRSRLPGARRHPFLFVEGTTGRPLSLDGAGGIFKTLKKGSTGLPHDLSAHVLRHTWNDRFSEMADENIRRGLWTVEDEKKARNEAMGWTPNSRMAEVYSRRHTRKKAREAMLRLQHSFFGTEGE